MVQVGVFGGEPFLFFEAHFASDQVDQQLVDAFPRFFGRASEPFGNRVIDSSNSDRFRGSPPLCIQKVMPL